MTIAQNQLRQIARTTDAYLTNLMVDGVAGLGWYERATDDISAFADAIGDSAANVACVTSIMSPRTSVARCASMAAEFFQTGEKPEGLMQQRWDSVLNYYRTFEVGSPTAFKIKAFAKALQGDPDACVNDTWIAKSFGLDYGKNGLAREPYAAITDRLTRLAAEFGISVVDAQACVWVGKRVEVGEHREGDAVADKSLCIHLPDYVA